MENGSYLSWLQPSETSRPHLGVKRFILTICCGQTWYTCFLIEIEIVVLWMECCLLLMIIVLNRTNWPTLSLVRIFSLLDLFSASSSFYILSNTDVASSESPSIRENSAIANRSLCIADFRETLLDKQSLAISLSTFIQQSTRLAISPIEIRCWFSILFVCEGPTYVLCRISFLGEILPV